MAVGALFSEENRPRLAASHLLGFLQPGESLVEALPFHQVAPDVVTRRAELRVDLLLPQLRRLPQKRSSGHFRRPPSPAPGPSETRAGRHRHAPRSRPASIMRP